MKSDLTVVILVFNEELHLQRCLQSISELNCRVVVVDSYSKDSTVNIAEKNGGDVFYNEFFNQSTQFQWAMDNCDINSKWVLRLDADEVVDSDLIENVKNFIEYNGFGHNAAIFHRKHIFLGKWIKYGGRYPLPMLRLFRRGYAQVEQRWMDEHIVLDSGTSTVLKGGFSDDNLNTIGWFIDKHNKYATREMVDIKLKQLYGVSSRITSSTSIVIKGKRYLKDNLYLGLPYFLRPILYFFYRYFFQFGFLDGVKGFGYHFMQGLWYRALVDLKCLEIDRLWVSCSSREEKHKKLEEYSGYKLDSPFK